jgi:hypothetical protein
MLDVMPTEASILGFSDRWQGFSRGADRAAAIASIASAEGP